MAAVPYIFDANQDTPATLANRRAVANAMLESSLRNTPRNVGEGLTAIGRALTARAMMDDVQAMWAPRASQDNVSLMVGYEGDTELAARVVAVRLKQVFNNLIGNALKFARNGVVEASLKATAKGDRVLLEARVRDDGPGVEADRVDVIFEPFVHGSGPDGALCAPNSS